MALHRQALSHLCPPPSFPADLADPLVDGLRGKFWREEGIAFLTWNSTQLVDFEMFC